MEIDFLTWEEQIELLQNKGLNIKKEHLKEYKNIGYYKLQEYALPLDKILLTSDKEILNYNDLTFEEILTRYEYDKQLRMELFNILEKIEISIKNNISYELGKKYGAFGYLNFPLWINQRKYTKFQIENRQTFLKTDLLKFTLSKKRYHPEFQKTCNFNKDGFPCVWLGINILTFGNIVFMLELMNQSILKKLSYIYKCSPKELISWLKCANFVRNICAHNSNLIDLQLYTRPKLRKNWIPYLYFQDNKPTNKLATILLILITLVKEIDFHFNPTNIQSIVNNICTNEFTANLLGFNNITIIEEITKQGA